MAELVGPRLYSCCNCRNHVALHDDIISKTFQGRHGRAFLFTHAMNIAMGPKEDRHLLTGLHTVADVYCADCREVLGWKYERAFEASQKYKEGKFILEKSKIVRENCMMEREAWPPLMVVFDPKEGFTVEADRFLKDLTILKKYVGDVDYLKNGENDDG